jgi:hypothetical protein
MDRDREILERFRLCTRCGQLFQRRPLPGYPTPQRCRCRRASDLTWPGYDFNQHLELCRCCHLVALPSGSRWSVWFCEDCTARVRAFNERIGRTTIPIGRHSLMAGVGLSGSQISEAADAELDRLVDELAGAFLSLAGATETLEDFVRRDTGRLAGGLRVGRSGSVGLTTWLRRLAEAAAREPETFGTEASFRWLLLSYSPARLAASRHKGFFAPAGRCRLCGSPRPLDQGHVCARCRRRGNEAFVRWKRRSYEHSEVPG